MLTSYKDSQRHLIIYQITGVLIATQYRRVTVQHTLNLRLWGANFLNKI